MWDSLDLRKFPRLNLKCEIEIQDPKHALKFTTVTENLGAGGVCVIVQREIPRLNEVVLRLYLADQSPAIECHGKVKWIVKSQILFQTEVRYDTGIEFVDIKNEDRERIRKVIDANLKKN